jgi:hypothetical protein
LKLSILKCAAGAYLHAVGNKCVYYFTTMAALAEYSRYIEEASQPSELMGTISIPAREYIGWYLSKIPPS